METRIMRTLRTDEYAGIYENRMKQDFPAAELKPLKRMLEMEARGIYEGLGLFEGDAMAAYGFFTVDAEHRYLLLDYLAVHEKMRSHGFGSKFLEQARAWYRDWNGILLECESLDGAQGPEQLKLRKRRQDFYHRAGCVASAVQSRVFGVEYDILYLPIKDQAPQMPRRLEELYELMFNKKTRDLYVECWERESMS